MATTSVLVSISRTERSSSLDNFKKKREMKKEYISPIVDIYCMHPESLLNSASMGVDYGNDDDGADVSQEGIEDVEGDEWETI